MMSLFMVDTTAAELKNMNGETDEDDSVGSSAMNGLKKIKKT